ncbi:MAG TPA: serine/threonine-protein kinase [Bryobacteraceae bacterium]|nr:serine/threonine-protein kinase [Bryobacteraceae bacterium]
MNAETLCLGCMEDDSGAAVCPRCGSPADLGPRNAIQLPPRAVLHNLYIVGKAIGHGGFGITYLAWDTASQTRVAIKEYFPKGFAGRAAGGTMVVPHEQTRREFQWGLDRFLDEARTLQRFSSLAGIVSVETLFSENGTAYLVMEHLDGWTFEEFLTSRGGFVPMKTAIRVMLPVMDALGAIHAEGILHRDISPDNIYLTRTAQVKLIDFGAARNALIQKSRRLSIVLKEGYAPEEQYRASGIQGPWTDVYATAATFYHAITGKIPQPALDRLVKDKLEPPGALGIRLPRPMEAALMKALSVRAADRFQSMQDFRSVLTGESDLVTPPKPSRPPAPTAARRVYVPAPVAAQARARRANRRWLIPAILGLLALLGLLAALSRAAAMAPNGPRPAAAQQAQPRKARAIATQPEMRCNKEIAGHRNGPAFIFPLRASGVML